MALQSDDVDVRTDPLHLESEERQEAEYHRQLASIVQPVEDAVAAMHRVGSRERCAEWAAEHRESLEQVAQRLRETRPPEWLHVYRDSFLDAIELFLRAADCLESADERQADATAERAEGAWEDAEELVEGLI